MPRSSEPMVGDDLVDAYRTFVAEVYETLAEEGFPDLPQAATTVFRDIDSRGSRLADLAAQAGFSDAEVRTETGKSNFASIDAFLEGMAAGSPSTRHALALVPAAERPAFLDEIRAALQPYVEDGKLRYPTSVNVLTATRTER